MRAPDTTSDFPEDMSESRKNTGIRGIVDYLTEPSAKRIEWLAGGIIVFMTVFGFLLTRGDLVAQGVRVEIPEVPKEAETPPARTARELPLVPYTLRDLELHPDRAYETYFSGAFFTDASRPAGTLASAHEDFRMQLEIYRVRAGVDDNFSIRVYDNRTWRTLEVFTLVEERRRYEEVGSANWDRIDALRRTAHRQLLSKWVARGIPRDAVAMRWGRLDQILEAREREAHIIEYEIRYARHLGMSLLPTEIGTVETFNQDWLISTAGARGRYQMMPDILDLFELRSYSLSATAGQVSVREEQHPLMALLGSFQLVRGYSNSVGHEIPGVSAYHTGPGNIFIVYQTFLRARAGNPEVRNASVIDAYMWGVTSGFDRVRQQSSFGPASRGYVLSTYGAIRAVDEMEIDPSRTLHTERVQLNAGSQIRLSSLLELLEPHGNRLNWGAGIDDANLYERFRRLNPHMALPRSGSPDNLAVPDAGNILLVADVNRNPVRFFLPHGATDVIDRIRPSLLNSAMTMPFDDNTFADPAVTGEKTQADYAYDQLVSDISRFGFSTSNRNRLERLYNQFVELAAENPTPYRTAQLRIIIIHRRVWGTRGFRDLAGTVDNVIGARTADNG